MKDFLQGKPLRHPLHPALVHFPIALFFLSFLLDLAGFAWPDFGGFVAAAFYSMALGLVTALAAAVPGFVDYSDIRNDHPAKKYATAHMVLNLIAVGAYGLNLGLRYNSLALAEVPRVAFFLSLAGVLILSISGYLGGAMVFDHGISVGRHRRKTDTPQQTIKVSSATAERPDNFIQVADARTLKDRETLRVQIDDTVIVIAKLEGQFYAFQEFCTHRFGPLSEGSFDDGQVQCPWHRSCFDVRTGKVTRGPAKTDLKTYAVEVRRGKIFVAIPPLEPQPEFIAPPKKQRRFLFQKLHKSER